jgi:hypothetical protein
MSGDVTQSVGGDDEPADWADEEDEGAEDEGEAPVLSETVPARSKTMTLLVMALPLFGQFFHYMKDLLPLWALSKAFPVLSLPLILVLIRHPRPPVSRQILLTFIWLVLVPTFAAIFYFNQNFFIGIAAQVKLLPLLYFFSFLGFLLYFRPMLRELSLAFLVCGVATYVALVILWAVIPQSWYSDTYVVGTSPLFSLDNRGDRIRMPMYFGIVTLFYCYRRFLGTRRLVWLLGALVGFGVTLGIVKTRAMIVGIAGVLVLNSFVAATPVMRLAVLFLAPFALAGLFSIGYLSTMFSTDVSSGFDVRWETAVKAVEFLGTDPIRWIFGVGTISPISSDSLMSYFNHFFFLADITWLGILFEFGLIGAALILLYEVRALLFYHRLRRFIQDDFLGSLYDYVIYVLLISNLYPPTLTPGETAVILAIFVYVWQSLHADERIEAELGWNE